jgi:hypothetical protein
MAFATGESTVTSPIWTVVDNPKAETAFLMTSKLVNPAPRPTYETVGDSGVHFSNESFTEVAFTLNKVTPDKARVRVPLAQASQIDVLYKRFCPVQVADYEDLHCSYAPLWKSVTLEIERGRNRIARTTYRGRANNMILNPNPRPFLQEAVQKDHFRTFSLSTQFQASWVPPNGVFVFYKGKGHKNNLRESIDTPGICFVRDDYCHLVFSSVPYGRMILFHGCG